MEIIKTFYVKFCTSQETRVGGGGGGGGGGSGGVMVVVVVVLVVVVVVLVIVQILNLTFYNSHPFVFMLL